MTSIEKILENGYEDITIFSNPSYDSALIGVSDNNRAVYDFNKMVEWLVLEENMTEEDAIEFIEYNTVRSLSYVPNSPIIVYSLIDFDEGVNNE